MHFKSHVINKILNMFYTVNLVVKSMANWYPKHVWRKEYWKIEHLHIGNQAKTKGWGIKLWQIDWQLLIFYCTCKNVYSFIECLNQKTKFKIRCMKSYSETC